MSLSIGFCTALVLLMVVRYEFEFNAFVPDGERVFRVVSESKFNGMTGYGVRTPNALAREAEEELEGLELSAPLFSLPRDTKITVEKTTPDESELLVKDQKEVYFTNRDYFELLNLKWLAGQPSSVYASPFEVVLTKGRAQEYFPGEDPDQLIGRRLDYNSLAFTLSGIVEDLPLQSDFQGKDFLSLQALYAIGEADKAVLESWDFSTSSNVLYLKLKPDVIPARVERQLSNLLKTHSGMPESEAANQSLNLQPLSDLHFDSRYQDWDSRLADKKSLYGLIVIAAFVLLLGALNYVNLSTAQASRRAKEVGVRKCIGSSRKQLLFQFLGETTILTSIALLLSLSLLPLVLRLCGDFIPSGLDFYYAFQPEFLFLMLAASGSIACLAGIYPALVLTRYQAVEALKNQSKSLPGSSRQLLVRSVLTFSQFSIAQLFVLGSLFVGQQMRYLLQADLGFDQEAIITLSIPQNTGGPGPQQLKQRIQAIPGVRLVSSGYAGPAMAGMMSASLSYKKNNQDVPIHSQIRLGDEDYLAVYGISLNSGRLPNSVNDSSIRELVVNEAFANSLGFKNPAEAIDSWLNYGDDPAQIVGIMPNFHAQSLRFEQTPVAFALTESSEFIISPTLHIKLNTLNGTSKGWNATIKRIGKIYQDSFPDDAFNYAFVDEEIAHFYEKEQRLSGLLNWATGLTIVISCMGLFGSITYTVNTRAKELGIRKVLGASAMQLMTMLSKDYMKIIVLGFIVSAPVAYLLVARWLDDFAYRIPINGFLFATALLSACLLSLFVLSLRVIRSSRANPVDSLRDE